MIRDYRLSSVQGVTGRGAELRTEPGMTNDTVVPAYPRANQELVLVRKVFQHLAKADAHPERSHPGGFCQKVGESDIAQRPPAELGEQSLLAQPGLEFVAGGGRQFACRPLLIREIGQRSGM